MTRKELEEYIYKTYKVRPDYPWKRDRENGVFRHAVAETWLTSTILSALSMRLIPRISTVIGRHREPHPC